MKHINDTQLEVYFDTSWPNITDLKMVLTLEKSKTIDIFIKWLLLLKSNGITKMQYIIGSYRDVDKMIEYLNSVKTKKEYSGRDARFLNLIRDYYLDRKTDRIKYIKNGQSY